MCCMLYCLPVLILALLLVHIDIHCCLHMGTDIYRYQSPYKATNIRNRTAHNQH